MDKWEILKVFLKRFVENSVVPAQCNILEATLYSAIAGQVDFAKEMLKMMENLEGKQK